MKRGMTDLKETFGAQIVSVNADIRPLLEQNFKKYGSMQDAIADLEVGLGDKVKSIASKLDILAGSLREAEVKQAEEGWQASRPGVAQHNAACGAVAPDEMHSNLNPTICCGEPVKLQKLLSVSLSMSSGVCDTGAGRRTDDGPASSGGSKRRFSAPFSRLSFSCLSALSGSRLSREQKICDDEGDDASRIALLFPGALFLPGECSRYVKIMQGMQDIPAVAEILKTANSVLGMDIFELCQKGPLGPEAQLIDAKFCQPAMFIAGLAFIEKLRQQRAEAVDRCQCVAGFSVGEYTALCFAGVFSFKDGLEIVKLRGEAMEDAANLSKQATLSVARIEKPKLVQLCAEASEQEPNGVVQIAQEFFPQGFLCAGNDEAVSVLKKLVKSNGAFSKLLKPRAGQHTDLMAPAAEKLAAKLDATLGKMRPPSKTIYMNTSAKAINPGTDPKEIVMLLKKELTSAVLWEPSVRGMIRDGVTEFYEVGPMQQLKAMMEYFDPTALICQPGCVWVEDGDNTT
mmetsp:Transcript_56202/g.98122  ORF Transcript_56202/g.98122 Transcript_56202/m.98122 type:complete len:514 (+) Transcript_56202:1-1542(+)